MKFCSNCGNSLSFSTPSGDDRPRYLCDSCGTIHYQNPLMVVGCIPESETYCQINHNDQGFGPKY